MGWGGGGAMGGGAEGIICEASPSTAKGHHLNPFLRQTSTAQQNLHVLRAYVLHARLPLPSAKRKKKIIIISCALAKRPNYGSHHALIPLRDVHTLHIRARHVGAQATLSRSANILRADRRCSRSPHVSRVISICFLLADAAPIPHQAARSSVSVREG